MASDLGDRTEVESVRWLSPQPHELAKGLKHGSLLVAGGSKQVRFAQNLRRQCLRSCVAQQPGIHLVRTGQGNHAPWEANRRVDWATPGFQGTCLNFCVGLTDPTDPVFSPAVKDTSSTAPPDSAPLTYRRLSLESEPVPSVARPTSNPAGSPSQPPQPRGRKQLLNAVFTVSSLGSVETAIVEVRSALVPVHGPRDVQCVRFWSATLRLPNDCYLTICEALCRLRCKAGVPCKS